MSWARMFQRDRRDVPTLPLGKTVPTLSFCRMGKRQHPFLHSLPALSNPACETCLPSFASHKTDRLMCRRQDQHPIILAHSDELTADILQPTYALKPSLPAHRDQPSRRAEVLPCRPLIIPPGGHWRGFVCCHTSGACGRQRLSQNFSHG